MRSISWCISSWTVSVKSATTAPNNNNKKTPNQTKQPSSASYEACIIFGERSNFLRFEVMSARTEPATSCYAPKLKNHFPVSLLKWVLEVHRVTAQADNKAHVRRRPTGLVLSLPAQQRWCSARGERKGKQTSPLIIIIGVQSQRLHMPASGFWWLMHTCVCCTPVRKNKTNGNRTKL